MGIVRKTKSLDLLLDEFKSETTAISTIELIKRLHSKLNKTTVYRVLDNLEDDGILHSFLDKDGIKWYAMCNNCTITKHADRHPHFECVACGKIDCLKLEVNIPEIPNREVSSSQILLQGRCEDCLNLK
jgi:Fur family ferric uptake transcriptional regulator